MKLTLLIMSMAWLTLTVTGCAGAPTQTDQNPLASNQASPDTVESADNVEAERTESDVVSSPIVEGGVASSSAPKVVDAESSNDAAASTDPAAPPTSLAYPGNAPLGRDLDIVVRQYRRSLTLINREPEVFEGMELWINQQYVTRLDRIVIGDGNTVSFRNLLNRHGEVFPTPTLLTPENAYPAVLAELFDPRVGRRHRLVARARADLLIR